MCFASKHQILVALILVAGAACEENGAVQSTGDAEAGQAVPTLSSEMFRPPGRIDTQQQATSDVYDSFELDQRLEPFANEECCSDPGEISGCWWEDADADGITCSPSRPCPDNARCNYDLTGPMGQGLCECDSHSDCNDGIVKQGVCNLDAGVCGPSFCNGYLVCACWGGCKPGTITGYDTPKTMCEDKANGYAGYCCEGAYSARSDGSGLGFCANTPSCLLVDDACTNDSECNDGSPCTVDRCDNGLCNFDPIDEDVPEAPGCGTVFGTLSSDCAREWCVRGSCTTQALNIDGDCTNNPQGLSGSWYGAAPRVDDADGSSCYYLKCDDAGQCLAQDDLADSLVCDEDDGAQCTDEYCLAGICEHDPAANIGLACNEDDDACTLDRCDTSGACVVGADKDCDDSNWCTSPDSCVDSDPNHIVWTCENTAVSGNSTDYGYTDSADCSDLLCVGGFEDPTPTDCSAYNPSGYDMQCNSYACVDGNGEDNCTLEYMAYIGDSCSDGDACTLGDTCQDGGGYGVCQPGAPKNCDDGNACTADSCAAGLCVNTELDGAGCDADGDPCTVDDTCNASGTCLAGPMRDCSTLTTQCANGVCNSTTGACEADYLPTGTPCNADNNACTVDDACDGAGNCVPDPVTTDCSALDNVCNTGVCNTTTGNCERDSTPHEGDPCDADGSACTPDDTCQSGTCTADAAVDCSGFEDACNSASCNPVTGNCEYDNAALVDTPCNLDDNGCTSETCQGPAAGAQALTCTALSTVDCDDGNVCTADSCQSLSWNTYQCNNLDEPDTTACDFDNNGCTQDDHCDGAGACVVGTTVTDADCETALGVDTDCNTAQCVDDDVNSYHCEAVIKATVPGDCNVDNDGCTLDECIDSGDPAVGAVCTVGAPRDCSSLDNPPCISGSCSASNDYDSSCVEAYAPNTTACNADSDGCTIDDHCNDTGTCVAGTAATCTPPNACQTSSCTSTGDNSYACNDAPIPDCCLDVGDCAGSGLGCEGAPAPPDGCATLACTDNACVCELEPELSTCTDYDTVAYPPNCYSGACDDAGGCQPTSRMADNNLCSDLFDSADITSLDTNQVGYLGAIPGDGAVLETAGSTLCAENNYRSSADQCDESASGDDLGDTGRDVAYAFEYQTNTSDDYQLYAYVVKVQAYFKANLYVATDITAANECPEGNHPGDDDPSVTSESVASEMCAYPYQTTPLPPVLEETCTTAGNASRSQECCDPCVDGDTCGYKWCKRGYDLDGSACDMCQGAGGAGYDSWTHTGDCDALWIYPEDPYDCDSMTPSDPGYSGYSYTAVSVVSPDGDTDGSTRKMVVFVDGVAGQEGNFYLTVERVALQAGPCARANDDTRVYDVTDVGASGQTFLGTLDGVVNSEPATGGTCGGHDCSAWSGVSGCHESASANEFWPNREYFKIHRDLADGDQTYCIQTDESIANGANLTLVAAMRTDPTAATICDEAYTYIDCENDTDGDDLEWEFKATAGELYLLSLSQYDAVNRPCLESEGDDCRYALTVTEGACPSICSDPLDWYGASPTGTYTVNGEGLGFDPDAVVDGDTSDSANRYDPWGGWGGEDELWQLDVAMDAEVQFSGCDNGGYGSFDGQVALYDCRGVQVTTNDDGCGSYGMPDFTATLESAYGPYYLLVDGYAWDDEGAFGIAMWYPNQCSNGAKDGDETDVDCGGSICSTCPDGSSCGDDDDCDSGSCVAGVCEALPACSEATATDLGNRRTWMWVQSDDCLMVRDNYPNWWNTRNMLLQNRNGSGYSIPFDWSSSCTGDSGSDAFDYNWHNQYLVTTNENCATIIDLQGSGGNWVQIRWTNY